MKPRRPLGMSPRRTAIIGGLMVATGPLSLTLYSPALPTIVGDFGTTDAAGKLTLTVYFAAFAMAQLICGPLSDRFGRRAVGLAFFAIYVLGSLIAAVAPSLEVLFLGRFVQGFGVSAGVALSRAMVRDQFVGSEAIRILTLINLILTVTPAVAPTLGSVILLAGTWHYMFVVMAGFGLAILALLTWGARETLPPEARVPFSPSIVFSNYRLLLSSPDFLFPSLLLGLAFSGFHGFTALLPFIFIDDMGLTPFQFAMAMLGQTVSFILGNLAAGYLARRVLGTRLVSIALVAFAASGLGFATLPLFFPASVVAIMAPVGIWMFGIAFISPSATAAAMAGFGAIAGAAGALTGFFQVGGGFVGSLAAGTLFPDARTALVIQLPVIALLTIGVATLDRRRRP
ncbi:MFS transporter, DHA1 family, bicyclomycin/chloramphenicol resistance protein [Devosia lucknowensis]|uniref:Bcr/CflA family efflux transporter n=1 Tax=Devosia lucknowensis TaxID=1096929 RepID=A0A1Y6FT04_9HYPH|nr:multidrug effflux MFS transporter [Devosia lucknowensis]SMQ75673.1 MFS transporter, DHA1 family, bicyclomycin/chloramphenicol resistance protein [Devosia lucknowensis]